MDRKKEAKPLLHAAAVLCAGKHGDHGGVPVVAVEDIRLEILQTRDRIQNRPAEIGILLALAVTAEIDRRTEILFAVDEVDDHPVDHEFLETHIFPSPAEIAVEAYNVLCPVAILLLDDPVIRHDDSGVHTEFRKRLRKRSHHIRKSPCFGQRRAFRADQKDLRHAAAIHCRSVQFRHIYTVPYSQF